MTTRICDKYRISKRKYFRLPHRNRKLLAAKVQYTRYFATGESNCYWDAWYYLHQAGLTAIKIKNLSIYAVLTAHNAELIEWDDTPWRSWSSVVPFFARMMKPMKWDDMKQNSYLSFWYATALFSLVKSMPKSVWSSEKLARICQNVPKHAKFSCSLC